LLCCADASAPNSRVRRIPALHQEIELPWIDVEGGRHLIVRHRPIALVRYGLKPAIAIEADFSAASRKPD